MTDRAFTFIHGVDFDPERHELPIAATRLTVGTIVRLTLTADRFTAEPFYVKGGQQDGITLRTVEAGGAAEIAPCAYPWMIENPGVTPELPVYDEEVAVVVRKRAWLGGK